MRSTHADPTANVVIAKITREERESERRLKHSNRRKPERNNQKKAAPTEKSTAALRYSEWASLAG